MLAASLFSGCAKKTDERLLWQFATGDVVPTCPAVAGDGAIYLESHDKKLYRLHSNGTLDWSFDTGDYAHGSPTVSPEGIVFVGSFDHYSSQRVRKAQRVRPLILRSIPKSKVPFSLFVTDNTLLQASLVSLIYYR